MANGIRIDNLNSATSLNDTDIMTIVQDKENKKLPMSLIDCYGSYSQSVINTIPDLITTSKSNVETIKQTIDEKFGEDEFSAQINTVKEMSNVGVSDDGSVDISSQVQDGFMETAVLYGKTLVNNVTADTSQDDYVSFDKDYSGQNFSISGTVEGSIKSAILKGQTLVNLSENLKTTTRSVNGWYIEEKLMDNIEKIKRNTYYTILYRLENISGNHQHYNGIELGIGLTGYNKDLLGITGILDKNGGWCKIKFQLTDELIEQNPTYKQLHIRPIRRGIAPVKGESVDYTIRGFAILEGDYITNPIPFNKVFKGMQSVKMPVLTTTGKNLFKLKAPDNTAGWGNHNFSLLENGFSFQAKSGWNSVGFNVGYPNQQVTVSATVLCSAISSNKSPNQKMSIGNVGYVIENRVNFVLGEEKRINSTFNLSDTGTVWFYGSSDIENPDFKDETVEWVIKDIQVELGSTSTTYEPYQSNILTVNEEVELRGIGDVKDTLDCLTGEIVSNFSTYSFSDVDNWRTNTEANCQRFTLRISPSPIGSDYSDKVCIISDKLPGVKWNQSWNTVNTISCNGDSIAVQLPLGTTIEQFKELMRGSKIVYRIKSSIKTVDLTTIDQDGHITNNIHTFNETTHINTSSQGLIPEVSISKSVSYDALIKPNTQYTIDLKHNDKDMIVNVGGNEVVFSSDETRKTITTPSTLTNNTLSYYGLGAKANSIMLLEGNETRDLNYFTGMKSVKYTTHEDRSKLPILHTVGKNLFNKKTALRGYYVSETTGEILGDGKNSLYSLTDYIEVIPNRELVNNDSASRRYAFYDKDKIFISGAVGSRKITVPSNAKYLRWSFTIDFEELYQIEYGSTATSYEPYKTSILSTENDLIMRSNGSTRDSLDLITGKFTQRIDEDGNILATPIETTIDINSNLGDEKLPIVYKGGHILLQSDELTPELQYSIPISYSGLIAQNTMTNLRHSWRLDELELLAYASIVNSQYDSLILVSTAETNDIMVSSDYVPDVSLYNMLKVLVGANVLQNADEKISTFYLYGKLSDEMFIDLIMGDDM